MNDSVVNIVEEFGDWAFYFFMFLEGSAFPLFGTFIVVSYGYIADLTMLEMILLSLAGAVLYTVGSWIPFFVGIFLNQKLVNRFNETKKQRMESFKQLFSKYGTWSIALASPLHLGNLVPFAAGMSQVNLWKYSALTILGIAPSTFLLLLAGHSVPGDINDLVHLINQYQWMALATLVILTLGFPLLKKSRFHLRMKRNKNA